MLRLYYKKSVIYNFIEIKLIKFGVRLPFPY